jgi:hypothetical protein
MPLPGRSPESTFVAASQLANEQVPLPGIAASARDQDERGHARIVGLKWIRRPDGPSAGRIRTRRSVLRGRNVEPQVMRQRLPDGASIRQVRDELGCHPAQIDRSDLVDEDLGA